MAALLFGHQPGANACPALMPDSTRSVLDKSSSISSCGVPSRMLPSLRKVGDWNPDSGIHTSPGRKRKPKHVLAIQNSAVSDAQNALLKTSNRSSQEYNELMRRQMANPYEYQHDLGIYYHRVTDHLIVGSQPQTPQDVDRLHRLEGVSAILNLQQDHDIHYWGIDINLIQDRCKELGVRHYRRPARDFDPHSLRFELPRMVAVIDRFVSQGKTIYVHCTAGLGRAPGAAIAYLFWFHEMDLGTAYHYLTSIRPCGPKKEAIRAATYDLVKNSRWQPPLEHLPDFAFTDVAPWERSVIQHSVRSMY